MVQLLENPLRVGLQQERTPEPLILVIFGASGDLTARKLVPAIYHLKQQRRLPAELTIVGVARRDWSHDYFRQQMREGIEQFSDGIGAEPLWENFAQGLFYCSLRGQHKQRGNANCGDNNQAGKRQLRGKPLCNDCLSEQHVH